MYNCSFEGGKISYFNVLVYHEHHLFSPFLHFVLVGKDSSITLLAVSDLEIPASTVATCTTSIPPSLPSVVASSGKPITTTSGPLISPKTTSLQQQQSYTPTAASPTLYRNSRSPLSLLSDDELSSDRAVASKIVYTPTRKRDNVQGKQSMSLVAQLLLHTVQCGHVLAEAFVMSAKKLYHS